MKKLGIHKTCMIIEEILKLIKYLIKYSTVIAN